MFAKYVNFPSGWHLTYTANHWTNEDTTIACIDNIIIPYVQKERALLGLSDDHYALVLFDMFNGQCTSKVLKKLEDNNIPYVTMPNNCTDRLQPLDLSVNNPAIDFLRSKFQQWYKTEICQQLDRGMTEEVDMRMNVMKPLAAQWVIDYLAALSSIIINGFRSAGIVDCIGQL